MSSLSEPCDASRKDSVYSGTNEVPRSAGGKVLHVDVGPGEIANRVVLVGTVARAEALAACFDGEEDRSVRGLGAKVGAASAPTAVFRHTSDRGFTTFTGKVGGVALSVVAIGMGTPMMDFAVRELRSVVEGPMLMVRFGTCGGLRADVAEGSVCVASSGSVHVTRNPDAFSETEDDANCSRVEEPNAHGGMAQDGAYHISKVVMPDAPLSCDLLAALSAALSSHAVLSGLNATADSFYSSQGRADPHFDDRNNKDSGLLARLRRRHPETTTMEMETFALLDLARCSRSRDRHGGANGRSSSPSPSRQGKTQQRTSIRAAAAAIVVANRHTGAVMGAAALEGLEREGGRAVMQAVAAHPLHAPSTRG